MSDRMVVAETEEHLRQVLAAKWGEIAHEAVRRTGYFTAAVSGGRTPLGFYGFLSHQTGFPWDRTHLFLVDERLGEPEGAGSNLEAVRSHLLAGLAAPPGSVLAVTLPAADAVSAAAAYEKRIRAFFLPREEGLPAFDLVLLGLGADGHTASLFPGSRVLEEEERLVAAVPAGEGRGPRVTMTLPLLNHGRHVVFLVTGGEKREALARLAGRTAPTLPSSLVRPREGVLAFYADRAAAGR